jgi:hypothetical protein
MKKTIYLLLGILLLSPALAKSPPTHKGADSMEYAFAYTYTAASSPNYYNVTVTFYEVDITTGGFTSMAAPASLTITVTGGPLDGDVLDWPAGTTNLTLNGVYFPATPGGIIPATTSPASLGSVSVYQGVLPQSDL